MQVDDTLTKIARLRAKVRDEATSNRQSELVSAADLADRQLSAAAASHELCEQLDSDRRRIETAISEKNQEIILEAPVDHVSQTFDAHGARSYEVCVPDDPKKVVPKTASQLVGEYKALQKRAYDVERQLAEARIERDISYKSSMKAVADFWELVDRRRGGHSVP